MDPKHSSSPALQLPAELTIYTVGELHPQWLAWLAAATSDSGATATADGHAVEQADAAGMQLLLSLRQALSERGCGLAVDNPSPALHEACNALGLQGWLQQHSEAATA